MRDFMKFTSKTVLHIDIKYDSSELIMANQGGKHEIKIDDFCGFDNIDELVISVQLDPSERSRFNFIKGEADKHKERVANEN